MNGVPEQCVMIAMDVQADMNKSTPDETMDSVSALARCMTANGGHTAHGGHGMKIAHMRNKPHGGKTMTVMSGFGMGNDPTKYYGYGNKNYGYGARRGGY